MTFAWWHILVLLIPILPNLWSIWDIWTHPFKDYKEKMLWLVVAVSIPVLGGLLYILIGRRNALSSNTTGRGNSSKNFTYKALCILRKAR